MSLIPFILPACFAWLLYVLLIITVIIFLSDAALIPNVDQPDAGNIELEEKGRCCFPA